MASVEEFGPYLLLKKLSEDPLGEVFRAGRIGGDGLEQVVLLRIFNGRNVNGPHLWQRISHRRPVQQGLKSTNIGLGVDLGEVRGIPYAAYDYISGKSLRDLLVQSSTEASPIPADHALLIAERLALALSVAYEARFDDRRLVHGFVVPNLVMISNEGETRLLGFEASPGLADLAAGGAFGPDISRYLAPETLTGADSVEAPDKSDDVYSLGVVLFEMLTCRPLPAPGAGGWDEVVDKAQIAQEGIPLSPEVAALIKRSLAPRGQRLADAINWHKAITKVLADGGFNATTFNLAFYMHNLFRSEIERESREIEAEKTIEIPAEMLTAGPPPAAPAGARVPGEPAPAPAGEDTAARLAGYGVDRSESMGGRKGLIVGLAAVLVAVLAAGGGWYWWSNRPAPEPPPIEQTVPPEPEPATLDELAAAEAEPAEPAGPTPEEIQAQLAEMIDSRSAEMEAKLKQQYDERIQKLQEELDRTQQAAAEREAAVREQQRLAAEKKAQEEEQARLAAAAAAAEPEAAGDDATAEAAQQPAAGGDGSGAAKPPARGPATAAKPASAKPPEPAPPQPSVRLGDLVSFGPGVTPPELIRMPDPLYPTIAKRLNKSATVEVKVLVDEKGEVRDAQLSGAKAGYGFDQAALEAAKRATYRPATKDGVRVRMWTVLKVIFSPR